MYLQEHYRAWRLLSHVSSIRSLPSYSRIFSIFFKRMYSRRATITVSVFVGYFESDIAVSISSSGMFKVVFIIPPILDKMYLQFNNNNLYCQRYFRHTFPSLITRYSSPVTVFTRLLLF